ncbi:ATP-grasp domain-containing protein [Francisella sp. 19X1-34]|uniref:ATP-grasp domain-containing protein n=1 Tax=Francisella sp. 19X1-34 TaxID=3087177 RepID=UPI002E35156D|nr:ATP-grasp domain-containing protein [Francisella sp. 19X1-34]MED7787566.1 ATP-grasp domain-containing protein [Francisella sp. 19X1-34]
MNKLLINGGSHSEIPLIKAAKELGFYVITTGYDKDGLGHKFSDEYIAADFSNEVAIYNIVKNNDIKYVIPGCNDFSLLTVSYISEKMNIGCYDTYETSLILHHKDLFREFALRNNISVPKACSISSIGELSKVNFSYPIMVKAVDLSGGKGVVRVDNEDELIKAINDSLNISRKKNIVLEEYIDGTHHSASILIKDGLIVFDYFADEYFYLNKYLVAGANTSYNVRDNIQKKLLIEIEKVIKLLKLKDGIVHVQFIINNEDVYIIEITRRCPGDLYIDLVSMASSVNYALQVLNLCCGRDIKEPTNHTERKFITRHCIMADRKGKFEEIIYDASIRDNIIAENIWASKGDMIQDEMTDKLGIIFLEFASKREMLELTNNVHNLISVKLS